MQEKKERRSNSDRTSAMRQALVAAARALFVEKGYAETSTPEIVASANVTRGALYHHFADKAALFEAVVTAESEQVAEAINRATENCVDAADALSVGTDAYLDAMMVAGRNRLLLVDGPAVLGHAVMDRIDGEAAGGTMVIGLSAALGRQVDAELEARARLLSAAFERAALDIGEGRDPAIYRALLKRMLLDVIPNPRS